MLETIREYGAEQLASEGELEHAQRSHADFIVHLVERLRPRIEGPEASGVLTEFELEHPNIRAALTFAVESGDAELGNRIVASTWKFWTVHSHNKEGRRWMEQVLSMPGATTPAYRLEGLYAVASFALSDDDIETASKFGEEGLALSRSAGIEALESRMLFSLGMIAHRSGDPERSVALCEEALAISRRAEHVGVVC